MYGLGSIIGNIGTSVITPAVGGLVTPVMLAVVAVFALVPEPLVPEILPW